MSGTPRETRLSFPGHLLEVVSFGRKGKNTAKACCFDRLKEDEQTVAVGGNEDSDNICASWLASSSCYSLFSSLASSCLNKMEDLRVKCVPLGGGWGWTGKELGDPWRARKHSTHVCSKWGVGYASIRTQEL